MGPKEKNDFSDEGDNKGRLQAPADFDGPVANRRCTDILFALLLLVMWIAMTAVGVYSWNHGDHRAVLYPMDWSGNICGTNFGERDMTDFPKLVYINNLFGGVCVKECPKIDDLVDTSSFITYGGVFQGPNATLPNDFVEVGNYTDIEGVRYCTDDKQNGSVDCPTNPDISYFSKGVWQGQGYAYYALDTIEVLGVRCIANPKALEKLDKLILTPDDNPLVDLNSLNEFRSVWNNLYGDIYEARYHIMLFGALAAMLVGFVYAQLLRVQFLLGIMIWGSILGSIGIIIGCGVYAYTIANKWSEADPQEKGNNDIIAAKICAYVLWGIGGTITVITIFLRKQIMLSMACVRAACRALSDMPTMIFFPVIQVIGLAAFMLIWLVYAVHLASTGEITKTQLPTTVDISVRTYVFDDFTKKCGWYLIFCFFWTVAFIAAMGEIVIAMTVSKWYFTRDKSRLGIFTIFASIIEAIRYHIGTAAFGSFIIAVVQMIRAMVSRLQKKARELNNKVGEALLCCCQCLLWCFEKFIKFLNKNAYIQTAIFGTPFCRSAREAFSLIVRNAGKVASISYVSTLVLFVGRIFISSLTTGGAYVYMDHYIGGKLYSTAGPCAVIFFMSYYVGGMFLDIFDMSTSTILQCFVADEEMFDGDENYAEGDLRKWLDDFEEEEKRIVTGK